MTVDDAKKVTEVAKEKLKENGDVYSEHILAYISYLESQIGKMKCCGNCFNFSTDKRCADKIGSEVCDRWCIAL